MAATLTGSGSDERGGIDPAPLDPAAAASGSFYDAVPYDGGAQAGLLPGRLRGAAAALGFAPAAVTAPDVLDVGCGAGAQLLAAAQAGGQAGLGRMVGIDASAQACDVARGRGAGFGARWEIHHGGDGLLDPAVLGQFDVIYVIGTLYIMPAEVRARVLAGIAACLRPGGVVAMTYYAGVSALVRTRLARLLRDQNDPAWPVAQQVATARANIRQIAASVPEQGATRAVVLETLSSMAGYGDTVLFHEALGPVFDTLSTADVAASLAERGVGFVNYLPAVPMRAGAAGRAAALAADAWDFATGGGYRVALFGRAGGAGGAGLARPGLVWGTSLRLVREEAGAVVFTDPGRGVEVRTTELAAQAVGACLMAGPCDLAELRARVQRWLAARGAAVPAGLDAAMVQLLSTLWQAQVAWPELRDGR